MTTRTLPTHAAVVAAALLVFAGSQIQAADDALSAAAAPRWWKGNLHTHTFWSDGDDFPDMVADWYRAHDYNFLALSDHNVLSQGIRWEKESKLTKKAGTDVVSKYVARFGDAWVERRGEGADAEVRLKPLEEFRTLVEERGKFLMIPSEEISDKAEGVPIHINAANLKEPIAPLSGATVTEAITNNLRAVHDQAERAGREILAHLNHPNYHYAVTAHDLAHAVLERHFEIHNGHPGVNQQGDHHHPSMERVWDIANTIRLVELNAPPLFGVATDDSHNYHGKPKGSSSGRGWVMVRSTHLSPEYILRAIKAGDSYSSTGVVLRDVRYDAKTKTLHVDIEPDGDAVFTTQFIGSIKGVETVGEPIDVTTLSKEDAKALGRHKRKYSDRIGETLKTVEGATAEYQFTGEELYVRAVITSNRAPTNPSWEDQKMQAWTQPVGWKVRKSTP